ncbi:HPr kinase/phosphorylase [Paenibacillus sp. sgz302251]|uniref:HPr kinase/phosphorylase n=1 Tax=Paenibacillus sp. sgz302251 TaxID=3414493 RepID=UPI003C7C8B0B
MISTAKKKIYQAFGFKVESEISLPELLQISGFNGAPDIVIEVSDLSDLWTQLEAKNGTYTVKGNTIIFQVPNVATFCIQEGKKIIISPAIESDMDEIRLYILGSCMGALLLQRKMLPLHGSAVAIDGKAYAFVGESGAGKSTLASALLGRGFPLLSDDVIAVSLSGDQQIPYVIPSYPQQKLWQESMDHLGMDSTQYRPLVQRETKFSVLVTSNFLSSPLPLAGVFELVKTEKDKIYIQKISRLESLPVLYQHTFRNFLVNRMDLTAWHFEMTAMLANQMNVFRLQRPVSDFTTPDLVSLILTTINKDVDNHDY